MKNGMCASGRCKTLSPQLVSVHSRILSFTTQEITTESYGKGKHNSKFISSCMRPCVRVCVHAPLHIMYLQVLSSTYMYLYCLLKAVYSIAYIITYSSHVYNPDIKPSINRRWDVDIPISEYGITENTGGKWKGDRMVIFNEYQLGLYPYLTDDGEAINGGIPQVPG